MVMTKVISGETMVSNITISTYIDSKIEEEATAVLAAIALTPSDAFLLLTTGVAKD
jgi:antitoxin component of RelBE/YafQ-DinJ toxin-antitoxin module